MAADTPAPEQVVLALADWLDYDPEALDDLRQIAGLAFDAGMGARLHQLPGWSAQERDRLVRDVLNRIAPHYAPTPTTEGAAT